MNINDAIKLGNEKLKKNNIKSSNLDSEIILSEVLNEDRKYLILNSRRKLSKNELNNYQDMIIERSFGKPIAYITGKKEFWKSEFKVAQGVLIPRPETIELCDWIIFNQKDKCKILDIGTGSGLIALILKKYITGSIVHAWDKSPLILKIAKENALKNNIEILS